MLVELNCSFKSLDFLSDQVGIFDTFHVIDNLTKWFGVRLICGINTVQNVCELSLTGKKERGRGGKLGGL